MYQTEKKKRKKKAHIQENTTVQRWHLYRKYEYIKCNSYLPGELLKKQTKDLFQNLLTRSY